jgi:pimeloyl-ACP methyl ester carboxylesterase
MKLLIRLFLLCCIFLNLTSTGFSQTAKRDTGILNDAAYEITIPANWNKKLVMYAHGYEQPSTPRNLLMPNKVLEVFWERGFATARSSYNRTGWALPEGVDDTEALRLMFEKKYGKPDSTFMTGHSMGGGVTVATIEKFPKAYSAALALCPLSTRPYVQTKTAFDGLIQFNALFPGIMPKVSDMMSGKAVYPSMEGQDGFRKRAYQIAMQLKGKEDLIATFAQRFDLKLEDMPFSLIFSEGVLRDMYAQTGGNPFDNTNTLYSGFPNDFELNQKVERLAATASTTRLTTYDRTGIVDKPLLMMHTTYDQLIAPSYGTVNYDNLVHQMNKEKNLKTFLTNGQGHCAFSNEQTGMAFDALRNWAKTGQKPTQTVLPSPPMPKAPDTLCYEMRIYTTHKGKLNDLMRRFRNHTMKIFENNGMTNVGYWVPVDNPDEKLYYILSYPNRAARDASWKSFMADTTWQRVAKESEVDGKIVAKVESIFLKSTDFSPNNLKESRSHVWEFRVYTATPNNLENLLSRFRDHTLKLFENYNITNKMYYTATDAKQDSDKMLYYFITHKSVAAAKESFDNFRKDEEWLRVRKASEEKGGGSLTTKVESIYMFPTDFSPIK